MLNWGISTRRIQHNSNNSSWSDWDVDASHTTCLHETAQLGRIGTSTWTRPLRWAMEAETKPNRRDKQPSPTHEVTIGYGPAPIEKQEKDRTTPKKATAMRDLPL